MIDTTDQTTFDLDQLDESLLIRDVRADDAAALCDIYNYYVANSIATFEEQAVTVKQMQLRIEKTCGALPWLVGELEGVVQGYAYASPWKGRSAYRYSVETSIYLRDGHSGRGLGGVLYQALLSCLGKLSLHSAIGGISLPNSASVALHEKLGFKKVAHFEEVGFKMNNWIDVGYWQLNFEKITPGNQDKPASHKR